MDVLGDDRRGRGLLQRLVVCRVRRLEWLVLKKTEQKRGTGYLLLV